MKLKKKYGQHLLTDKKILQKIISLAPFPLENKTIVEVGPGTGTLTEVILEKNPEKLLVIEKDPDMIEVLKRKFPSTSNLKILEGDFLDLSPSYLPDSFVFISNIPYYISTPILETLIQNIDKLEAAILTTQLEYYQRLVARVGEKNYSSLSIFAQTFFSIQKGFKIKRGSFTPPPKVDSFAFLLLPHKSYMARELFPFYNKIVRTAFSKRRKLALKTLHKELKIPLEKLEKSFQEASIPYNARPQDISRDQFKILSQLLKN